MTFSPIMPPKKEHITKVRIKKTEKGKSSICDEIEEDIESVRMPCNRTYKVKLHIRKIEKLKPSICYEIEEEIYL